jgi:hypothetical protein
MSEKAENEIARLAELSQRRAGLLEARLTDWARANLSPEKQNELIEITRNSHSTADEKNELNSLIASLTQPTLN